MLVSDRDAVRGRDLVELIGAATRGGVGMVQLREPYLSDDALRDLVQRVRDVVPQGTRVIVNSAPRVARTMRTGLHLPARAAALGGADLHGEPYGRSVHDADETEFAMQDGADYLVLGTIYPTSSKPGHPGSGAELVERICRMPHRLPVYAIGGITVARVPAMIHAGAHGVAVSRAILGANDPERVAAAMRLAMDVAGRVERDRIP
jgi:thiamine-phosphate pyrophosphorylase